MTNLKPKSWIQEFDNEFLYTPSPNMTIDDFNSLATTSFYPQIFKSNIEIYKVKEFISNLLISNQSSFTEKVLGELENLHKYPSKDWGVMLNRNHVLEVITRLNKE